MTAVKVVFEEKEIVDVIINYNPKQPHFRQETPSIPSSESLLSSGTEDRLQAAKCAVLLTALEEARIKTNEHLTSLIVDSASSCSSSKKH